MNQPLPLAICTELFEPSPLPRIAETTAPLGYSALEIPPFSLPEDPSEISAAALDDLRKGIEDAGMTVAGLHWLLARTSGLHAAHPDPEVTRNTIERLALLARICSALGGRIMVFGSPQQRSTPPGESRDKTLERFALTLEKAARAAENEGVVIALEPLRPEETDIVNTAGEAVEIIERVGSPALKLHLDAKAMDAEPLPREEIVRRYSRHLVHFHANDPNLLGPGMGALDLRPTVEALRESGYRGFLSVEVFDYSIGPEATARRSAGYLQEIQQAPRRSR